MTHDLKCWPDYFDAIAAGLKTAELRKNDRDFKVGDTLVLLEWRPTTFEYTGRSVKTKIRHIANVSIWAPGYVLMSIERLQT